MTGHSLAGWIVVGFMLAGLCCWEYLNSRKAAKR